MEWIYRIDRTNRSSPGPSIGLSQSPGALSDASARIAQVVRGLLRSEKGGLSRSCGVFSSSLPPSGTAVSYLSAVWCMSRVFAVPVRMMWLLVFAKVCCGCLPSGECNFSCTQIGYNSSALDARSLTLPRYCLGVGRSAKAGTYVMTTFWKNGASAERGWAVRCECGGEVR